MNNIKGIILDVDGVIVGEKIDFNSPWPNTDVIKCLREIRQKGIVISLLTAKPHFSIEKIILDAGLDNLHITDGGAVIIDPINNRVFQKHLIDSKVSKEIVKTLIENDVYTEFYNVDGYFIDKSQETEITKVHTHILQRDPFIVDSLVSESEKQEITKIMPISKDEDDKERIASILNQFEDRLQISWGIHPIALPHQFGIITAQGVSKREGAIQISKETNISFENMLGVGDSTSDWKFIELCNFVSAMGNSQEELKKLVVSKGIKNSFVSPSVDENGIIGVFNHFHLI